MPVIAMTSHEVRRSWSAFLEHIESGDQILVTYRQHPRLIAYRHGTHPGAGGPDERSLGDPVRVTSAENHTWVTARFIVIDSGLAKDAWGRLQKWVVGGGRAIINRDGEPTVVLVKAGGLRLDGRPDAHEQPGSGAPAGPHHEK
jgi:hypothetical protein